MSLTALLALAPSWAAAQTPCQQQLSQRLQSGGIESLEPLFAPPPPRLKAELRSLAQQAGAVSRLEPAEGPRFRNFTRQTVKSSGLPRDYGYEPLWVNAESSSWGAVQLHIALDHGEVCRVLALHLDRQIDAAEPGR